MRQVITPKIVILDLGNVLAFFDRNKTYTRLARHLKLPAKRIKELVESSDLREKSEIGTLNDEEFFEQIMSLFNVEHAIDFELFCRIWGDIFTPNRPLLKVLNEIKRKVEMVMLSNTNHIHFEYIENKHAEIVDIFRGKLVLSYREKMVKPDQRIFEKALETAGKDYCYTDCLYVDDCKEYVDAAKRLGMQGHQYTGLYQFTENLKRLKLQ